jgi:hypothetical protein
MYDAIGDAHGQGGKLKALLATMGYEKRAGAWHAPQGRQAVFVGDLIDRGPDQLEVFDTVRCMVDAGQALVVMGNHEFNTIAYAVRDPATGRHLRPRSDKNRNQHAPFLAEVGGLCAAPRVGGLVPHLANGAGPGRPARGARLVGRGGAGGDRQRARR